MAFMFALGLKNPAKCLSLKSLSDTAVAVGILMGLISPRCR